jgi:hypothetical protein
MAAGANTASPPILTPGLNHFNFETWSDSIEAATYQKQMFIPRIKEFKRPYSLLTVNKYARISSSALASTHVGHGTGIVYQDPKGTPPTIDPAGIYVALGWSENEDAENPYNLDSDLASEAERALAEGNDQNGLLLVPTLSQFRGDGVSDVSGALLRNAQALLTRNTNGQIVPGGDKDIFLILDASQYTACMAIEEYSSAEVRGDKEFPYVRGVWSKGGGHNLLFTTVVANDANGTHGVLGVREAFGVAWNVRSKTERQQFELQSRLILYNHLGTGVIHDLRAVGIRTGNTIPA